MNEIRIYVEGGGDKSDGRAAIRQGFNQFLTPLRELARRRRMVDAEGPVQSSPWAHLQARDGWTAPSGAGDEHCHLMVQTMEAWFIADPESLAKYYGQGFRRNSLPATSNVESIPKNTLEPALIHATKETRKGRYHKRSDMALIYSR
jgi:hypothetical protein